MSTYVVENETAEPDFFRVSLPLGYEEVVVRYGNVRVLRARSCKNNLFFAPFIPSSQVLIIFPDGLDVAQNRIRASAQSELSSFFSLVQEASSSNFHIKDAAVCMSSGCLVVDLQCADVEEALQVMARVEDVARQQEKVWGSNQYVYSTLCQSAEKILEALPPNSSSSSRDLLDLYYYYPVCPLCADRLDKTLSGYTSSEICRCSETFDTHCSCMETTSCHVCRLFLSTLTQKEQSSTATRCFTCNRVEDPWVCLICGYIGCSRYQAMHAKEHSVTANHCFSMNLLTQEVWDYESDTFVHRMVLCLDKKTGNTSRIHYPEREEIESFEVAKEPLEKKCFSAKCDTQLSKIHTQFSIMLKNKLDESRARLEREALISLAFQRAERRVYEGDQNSVSCRRSRHVEEGARNEEEEHLSVVRGEVMRATEELQLQCRNGETLRREVDAKMAKERELKERYAVIHQRLREAITESVETDLKFEREIGEKRVLLEEVKANLSVAAAISSRVGPGDTFASLVAVGGGRSGRSRRLNPRAK